jgi:hypothetical protein
VAPAPEEPIEPAPRRGVLVREGLIWAGFALLCLAAVLTVALPELRQDPDAEPAAAPDAGAP